MLRKNVVLIKKKRKSLSMLNRKRITTFLRSFYMVSIVIISLIGLLIFSVTVDEQSKLIGFGIVESAIEIYEEDSNYVMNFFSNKIEIPLEEAKETINLATDFAMCFVSPIIRAISQGIVFLVT